MPLKNESIYAIKQLKTQLFEPKKATLEWSLLKIGILKDKSNDVSQF